MMAPDGLIQQGLGPVPPFQGSASSGVRNPAAVEEFTPGPAIWGSLRTASSPQLKLFTALPGASKAYSEFNVDVLPEIADEGIYQAEQIATEVALGKKLASCWALNQKDSHENYASSLAPGGYRTSNYLSEQKKESASENGLCNIGSSPSLATHTPLVMPQGVWGACKSLPSRRWDTDATTVSATGELDPSPTYTAEAKSPTSPSRAGAFSAVPGVPYMRGGATAVVEYSGGQDKDKVVSNPPPMLRSRLGMQRQVGTDSFGNDSEASSVDSGSLRLGSTRGSGEFLGMTPMASEAGGEADDELSDDGMHGDDCRQVPNSSESGGDGGLGGTMGWYQTRIDVKDLLPYVPSIVLDDMFVPTKPSSSTADALRAGVAGGVSPPHDKDKDKEGEEGAVLRSFPYCSCMFAGVVIADVSGFSMLGELLYAYGDVGVEVFSEVLNYVLGAMISVVVEWEGQVTKIAGDALICVFPLKHHEAEEELARHVCHCACRLACVLEEQRSRNTFGLRVHVGVALGVVSCVHLSTRTAQEDEGGGEDVPIRLATCNSSNSGMMCGEVGAGGCRKQTSIGSITRQGGQLFAVPRVHEDGRVGDWLGSPRKSPRASAAVVGSAGANVGSRPRWRSFSSSSGASAIQAVLRRENSESDIAGDGEARPGSAGVASGDLNSASGRVLVSDFSFCGAVVADASRAVELATAGQVVVSGVVAFMLRESRWSFEEILDSGTVARLPTAVEEGAPKTTGMGPDTFAKYRRCSTNSSGASAAMSRFSRTPAFVAAPCGKETHAVGLASVAAGSASTTPAKSAAGSTTTALAVTASTFNGSSSSVGGGGSGNNLGGIGSSSNLGGAISPCFGGLRVTIDTSASSSDSDSDEDCGRFLNGIGPLSVEGTDSKPAVAHPSMSPRASGAIGSTRAGSPKKDVRVAVEEVSGGVAGVGAMHDWRKKSFYLCVDHHVSSLRMLAAKADAATSFSNRRAEVDAFMSEIMPHMEAVDGTGPGHTPLLPSPTSPKATSPNGTKYLNSPVGAIERISSASNLPAPDGDGARPREGEVARLAPGFLLPKGVVSSLPSVLQADSKGPTSPGTSPPMGPTVLSRQNGKLDLSAPPAGFANGNVAVVASCSPPLQAPSAISAHMSNGHAPVGAGIPLTSHFSKRLFSVLSPTCMPEGYKQLNESADKNNAKVERAPLPSYLRAEFLMPYIPSYVLRALSFGSPMRPEMRQVITIFCCLSLAEANEGQRGGDVVASKGNLNGSYSSSSGDEGSVRRRSSFDRPLPQRRIQRLSLDVSTSMEPGMVPTSRVAPLYSPSQSGQHDGRMMASEGVAARLGMECSAVDRASEREGMHVGGAPGMLAGNNKLRDRGDIDSEWIDGAHYIGGRMKESDLRRLNAAYAALSNSVARYKGTCRQFVRDDKGWTYIAVFGLVDSSQEDEYRAVLCALEMRDLLKQLGVLVRLGVAAGKALCGNVGSAARCEMAVVGRSVNLSARLACKAPQDGILVDDSIHRYTWGHVQYKPLGKMKFKGKEESVDVYVPVCELPHRMQSGYRRVSYMGHDATIPDLGLVGRSLEISELMACLSSMRHLRRGSVIIIDGEAGVGKTEMLRKLHLLARNMSIKVLMATGHTLEEANPYHFYTQLLSQLLDIPVMMDTTPGPNIAITRARLERKLEALLDPVTARDVPLLAIMFPDLVDGENHVGAVVNTSGVFGELSEDACFQPTPRRTSRNGESSGTLMPPSPAPSKGRKSPLARDADCASLSSNARRLLNLMKGIVSAVARRTPCVALVDDSLYMDSAFNRQLVTLLASLCKVMPVMLVMSHTTTPASAAPIPAEGNSSPPAALASSGTPAKSVAATDHKGMVALLHALMGAPNTKVLRLRCFTRVETGLFAMQVLNLARLPEELLAFVHSKTGGNPLFVKELLLCIRKSKCMLMDAGAQALTIDFSSIKLR
eukprot:jgi/Mesvir1/24975/Mv25662-RA.1